MECDLLELPINGESLDQTPQIQCSWKMQNNVCSVNFFGCFRFNFIVFFYFYFFNLNFLVFFGI